MTTTRRTSPVALAATALLLGVRPAGACSVPVFRYALERWPADMYRLVVFHRGPFSEGQQADLAKLKALQESEYGLPPLGVFPVDVAAEVPEQLASLWEKESEAALPRAALMYPAMTMPEGVAWSGPLAEAARVVVGLSPVRRELARRLIDGQTAVWLLVEKGDAAKDAEAQKVLDETLEEMKRELRLPRQMDPADAAYDMALEEGVDLKVEFSVMRLAPDNPKETLLVSILRGLLGKEMDESLPMAIPVFGRGRALAVIPEEQITDETVAEVCCFLVGPCSCQVKAMNPGFDILLPVDWDGLIMGKIGADEALPPLTVPLIAPPEAAAPGTGEKESPSDDEATAAPGPAAAPEEGAAAGSRGPASGLARTAGDEAGGVVASAPLARNLIVIGAFAVAGLAAATVLVLRRGRGATRGSA